MQPLNLSVSPLGTLEYRFVELGEEVPPETLSKIRMTVVPLPKEDAEVATGLEEAAGGLETLPGLGAEDRHKLNAYQIYTVGDLLRVGTRVRSRVALESMVGVDRERLGKWLDQAQLMTVRGVDGQAAAILQEVEVHSLADLARAEPDQLAKRYNARLGKANAASAGRLEPETAKRWVETAATVIDDRSEG